MDKYFEEIMIQDAQRKAIICTSIPYCVWKPWDINSGPFCPPTMYGIPLIRTNMKPPTMMRDVPMVINAHVQRDISMGKIKRASMASARMEDAVVAIRP